MASTRNINNPGNYNLQQSVFRNSINYNLNEKFGVSTNTTLPGNGFGLEQLPREKLSGNPVDTESFLFGINSTNLVEPAKCFVPNIKQLKSTNMYKNPTIIIPEPLVVLNDQRPHLN